MNTPMMIEMVKNSGMWRCAGTSSKDWDKADWSYQTLSNGDLEVYYSVRKEINTEDEHDFYYAYWVCLIPHKRLQGILQYMRECEHWYTEGTMLNRLIGMLRLTIPAKVQGRSISKVAILVLCMLSPFVAVLVMGILGFVGEHPFIGAAIALAIATIWYCGIIRNIRQRQLVRRVWNEPADDFCRALHKCAAEYLAIGHKSVLQLANDELLIGLVLGFVICVVKIFV